LYDRAEPLHKRALAIQEAALGNTHPDVATSLNNLGSLYSVWGLYDRAEPLYRRALAIRETALGNTHPDVATSLNNLASLYLDQGLYDRAEPLYRRALAIREATFGSIHPLVADSLNSLASLYFDQGLHDRAEPLYRRALAVRKDALGNTHPDVAVSLNNLALLRIGQHRLNAALPLFTRAFSMSEQRLRREALDFSEVRLFTFLQYMHGSEEALYKLLRAYPGDDRVRRLVLSAVLLFKGRSVEETANISRTIHQGLSVADQGTFEQLRSLRSQLAVLSFGEEGSLSATDHQKQRKALEEEGDKFEEELAKRSAPLRALTTLPGPDQIVGRVATSLPKGSALVEFIAYQNSALTPPPGTPYVQIAKRMHYQALVLFPDATTRAIDLGPAKPIDEAASQLREALANHNEAIEAPARRLHRLVFQPLRPLLGTTRRLFVSPDGQLGLIPFAALHDGHDFLLDSFDITYLTSGRELLPRPQSSTPASSVFVLADPNLSATPELSPSSTDLVPLPLPFLSTRERVSTSRAATAQGSLRQLPAARQEAEEIQRLLPQAQLFLGDKATKERLLNLPTPGILHLATHGFFLGNAPTTPETHARNTVDPLGGLLLPPPQPEPLLNSGLVLAASPAGPEGTRVTALELAGLDLWGTQLVVLSACDTGRGEVQLGQGISGLRRALMVAGAETVVSSLWSVNDDSTRQLMDAYYRNLLAGQGRASALREAMRTLRETHPHPYDWAPFIALGRDAPLQAIAPSSTP
jgi:CHAT domain-containing protein/Tfp pilus assembly protein PilF